MEMNDYNILYVDDEQANLNSLKSLFRRKFNFITAISGQKGLEILEAQPVQLIIADQRMPEMTGVQFLKKVKEKWPDIKSILFTAFHDSHVIKEAINDVGIYWYMNKPFENEKLELVIKKALEAYRSENLLKESEKKFKDIFNSIADGFVRRDLQSNIVLVSPSVQGIVGFTPEELKSQKIEQYFVNPQEPKERAQKLLREGGVHTFESEIIKKDGSVITISSSAKLYFDDAGNPQGIESVFRDITASKRTEVALKESEEKFRNLFNSMIDVFVRRDLEHKGVLVSPSIFEITGYNIEEVIGADISQFFVDPQKPERIKQKLLNEGGNQTFEFDLYKKDGDIISISSNAKLYLDNAGNPIGIESVFRDVSEQKKAEQALKESKERYQSLSDASFEAIFISEKGVCLEQNALAEKMFGYSLAEAIGRHGTDWIIPEDREVVKNSMLSGYEKPYEVTALRKDGSTFPAEIQERMMHFKGRDVRVTALNDVSRRTEAESMLVESEQKFRALVTNTEEIIYMIAKDGTFLLSEGKGLEKIGLKGSDVVGMSVFDLYKDYPTMIDDMKRAFNGETVITEIEMGDNYFKNWYTPHLDQKGVIIGLLGLSINITNQKKAELKILKYQNRLKELSLELTLTEEKQRKQLAVDLHDDVGQLLSSSRMQLAAIDFDADQKLIEKKIKDISQTLLLATKATREVIFNLSPPQLNEIGLYAAIHDWMKKEIEKKYKIRTSIIGDIAKYDLKENTRFLLFRSIRELLINVVKHARATSIKVILINDYKSLVIVVKDDGIGFDYESEKPSFSDMGFGLFSIQERISNVGGSITIDSRLNFGTEIKLSVPIG